jgi:hypothetical protein
MWWRTQRKKINAARSNQRVARPMVERLEEKLAPATVTGQWQGTLTQTLGGTNYVYNFNMDLMQNQASVTGTDYIQRQDELQAFAEMSLSGSVSGSTFTFQESAIIVQVPPPGFSWLLKSGSEQLSSDGNSMVGTWSPGGGPNSVHLTRTSNSAATVVPTGLGWDTTQGGVDFGYKVSTFQTSHATTVDLFWATGNQFADVIGGPITGASQTVAAGTTVGTYGPFNVPVSKLGTPPQGATYLLAVSDPGNILGNFDASTSITALSYNPHILPTSLGFDASLGGVDLAYQVSDSPVLQDTKVSLYWSSTAQFADVIGGAVFSKDVPAGTMIGSNGPYNVPASSLGTPPHGATYLLAVTDPANVLGNFDPSINVKSLAYNSQVAPISLGWDTTQGGVDFIYQVSNGPVPTDTRVALYWSSTTQFANAIGGAVYNKDIPEDASVGSYGPFNVPASALATPPQGAKYLLAVTDPTNVLGNFDPSTSVVPLVYNPQITPTSLTWDTTQSGVDFVYQVRNSPVLKDTQIALYWSASPQFSNIIGTPLYSNDIHVGSVTGSYGPFNVPASNLGTPPQGAKYILAVSDPGDVLGNFDPSTSVNALAYDPITANSATTTDSKSVTFQYAIAEAGIGDSIPVAVFRSSSATFDPNTAIQVALETIPAQDSNGNSSEALGTHTVHVILDIPLAIAPRYEYIFVVADPKHTIGFDDGTYKEAHFRKFVLGALAHGFDLFGGLTGLPAWETSAQQDLLNIDHYDSVIAFDWLSQSNVKMAGITIAQGQILANQIRITADALVASYGHPGDVVDMQVIGHSRGTVVVSQAMLDLELVTDPILDGGYKKMTLLDPHPANNSFSSLDYSTGNILFAHTVVPVYQSFQAAAVDPQVVIPIDINEVEIYYQHSSASDFSFFSGEHTLNLWGEDPSLILNYSTAVPKVVNLTDYVDPSLGVIGHSEVPLYYEKYVIQAGLAAS